MTEITDFFTRMQQDETDSLPGDQQYCFTCLSQDRQLFVYNRDHLYYFTILSNIPTMKTASDALFMCWECNAIVTKFLIFKKRAIEAQQLIESQTGLNTLSTLVSVDLPQTNFPIDNDVTAIKEEIEDVAVKEEPSPSRSPKKSPKKQQKKSPRKSIEFDDVLLESGDNYDVSDFDEFLPESSEFKTEVGDSDSDVCLESLLTSNRKRLKRDKNISKENGRYTKICVSEADMWDARDRLRQSNVFVNSEHKCSDCLVTFDNECSVKKHNEHLHVKKRRTKQCDICHAYVRQKEESTHRQGHFDIFSCDICADICCNMSEEHYKHKSIGIFMNKEALESHLQKVHKFEKKFKKARVKRKREQVKKRSKRNEYDIVRLSEKEMVIARERELNRHPYLSFAHKCESCIISFKTNKLLVKHFDANHVMKEDTVKCDICARYVKLSFYPRHKEDHCVMYSCRVCANECCFKHGPHFSEDCSALFINRFWLYHHNDTKHAPPDQSLTCEKCGKISKKKNEHLVHIESHNLIPCEICEKEIKGSYAMAHHMRHCHKTWKSEDTYCAECDIQYKNVYTYRCHLNYSKTHISNGERRYECQDCGKKYLNSYGLKDHRNREHLKIPQFPCEQCDQKFLAKKHLERHVRKCHDGYKAPRNQMCPMCNKGFTTKQCLKKHMYTHTGERPYKCQLCPATFTQDASLGTHHRLVHLKLKRNVRGNKVQWVPKQPNYDSNLDLNNSLDMVHINAC